HAFFIRVDGKLGGFAMVNDVSEVEGEKTDYAMAEFFVMYKYRRMGIGREVAYEIFERFPGKWQLKRHPKNVPSVYFWNKVIDGYTKGKYRLVSACPHTAYQDGTLADVFFFDNTLDVPQ
ncbi:MAG: GNAT family N-acetyltransferase, partial [Clostridia bacterium]